MEGFKFWVEREKETADYGRFVISPLPRGFGHTVGNSLRRVLLGYMEGAAVTQIKVKGATHPFAVLKGVKEDLIDIIMNIKQIRIAYGKDKPVKMKLEKKGKGVVKASDIKKAPGVEIKNPELVIANLSDAKSSITIDFVVERGVGYSLAEEHKTGKMGEIAVDAIFTPVVKANYEVKEIRVGKEENVNQVIVEIWTNETVSPSEAFKKAAESLVECFKTVLKPPRKEKKAAAKKEENDNLSLYLEELDLPLRLVNALKRAGYNKLSDFDGLKKADLAKVKNVGEKSVDQLIKALKKKSVNITV